MAFISASHSPSPHPPLSLAKQKSFYGGFYFVLGVGLVRVFVSVSSECRAAKITFSVAGEGFIIFDGIPMERLKHLEGKGWRQEEVSSLGCVLKMSSARFGFASYF